MSQQRGSQGIAIGSMSYSRHAESSAEISVSADRVFAYVDDHVSLSSHMNQSSWKMGGGKMTTEVDAGGGKSVGSKIHLCGKIFGIVLSVEEIVTERAAPYRKTWETIGQPKLMVIGHYRMGFEIAPHETGSLLRVFIDYALPETVLARCLGYFLARYYAVWCTRQMAVDAANHLTLADQ